MRAGWSRSANARGHDSPLLSRLVPASLSLSKSCARSAKIDLLVAVLKSAKVARANWITVYCGAQMRVSHDTNLQPGNRRRISRWASVSSCRVTQLKPLQSLNQSLNKRCCWRQRPDIKRIMSRSLRTDKMRPVTFLYWREAQTLSWRSPEEEFFPAGTRLSLSPYNKDNELIFGGRSCSFHAGSMAGSRSY